VRPWFAIIVTPLVALAQQSINYALVAAECAQQQRLPVHAVAAAALAIALIGAASAWRDLRTIGAAPIADSGDSRSNARLLALVGVCVSAITALAVIAMWLTAAFIPPCVR
jgi:hypothetical protein